MKLKVQIVVLLSTLLLCSCAGKTKPVAGNSSRQPASVQENVAESDPDLRAQLDELKLLVDEAMAWRTRSMAFYEKIKATMESGGFIKHDELLTLHESAENYIGLRQRLMDVVERNNALAAPEAKVSYEPGKGTSFDEVKVRSWKRAFFAKKVAKVVIDPTDEAGHLALMELKISLNAALMLYDNFLLGIHPYFEDEKIRRLLNRDHNETRGKLRKVTKAYVNRDNRRMLARAINFVYDDLSWRQRNRMEPHTSDQLYLETLLAESPTFDSVLDLGSVQGPGNRDFFESLIEDHLDFTKRSSTFYLSKFFGNFMGIFQTRKGKLTKLPEAEQAKLASEMKPLDILLEKTPFRVTDKFIPGHWGHVAIWVGSEEELKAAGVWEHPSVVPHQKAIRAGRRIVEALRPGVQINTLKHFLNIDDLLVLRHQGLSDAERKEYLVRTFEQVGKEYDFNFDVETDRKIVCSELAYVVYHNIEWPTSKTLGRYTISPDHVAQKALPGGVLYPVVIYHDGLRMPDSDLAELRETLRMLLQGEYKAMKKYLVARGLVKQEELASGEEGMVNGVSRSIYDVLMGP